VKYLEQRFESMKITDTPGRQAEKSSLRKRQKGPAGDLDFQGKVDFILGCLERYLNAKDVKKQLNFAEET
jgi:hypothetical protein